MRKAIPFQQLLLVSSIATATHALAFEQPIKSTTGDNVKDEMIITATRTPESLLSTLAPVSVFNKGDIERYQPKDLTELFRRLPGVNVRDAGGPGSDSSISIRGANSGHTLILVDGQRLSSATLGSTSFQYINPDQIEQIELVRGPRSSLYGSDAIGGVINIITKRGDYSDGVELGGRIRASYGTNENTDTSATFTVSSEDMALSISGQQQEVLGYDRQIEGGFNNDDNDAYRNTGINISFDSRIGDIAKFRANYLKNEGQNEVDNQWCWKDCAPYGEFELESLNLSAIITPIDFWDMTFSYGENEDLSVNADDIIDAAGSDEAGQINTERKAYTFQNDFTLTDSQLLTIGYDRFKDEVFSTSFDFNGVEIENEFIDSDTGEVIDSRTNDAIFGQYQLSLDAFNLAFGLREDDNESSGKHTTGNISLGFDVANDVQLITSYGTGYKAPTFNDLWWKESTFGKGNPFLEDEESKNIEIGLKGYTNDVAWQAFAFRNEFENLIEWAPNPEDPTMQQWTPQNVADARIRGFEVAVQTQFDEWDLNATYMFLDTEDGATEKQLRFRSRNTLSIDADRQFGKFGVGVSLATQGKQFTDAANETELEGFATVGLRGSYQITSEIKTQLTIENALDRRYQLRENFQEEGVEGMISIVYTPKF